MWCYVKTLEYPINLKCKDLKMANILFLNMEDQMEN